MTHSRTEQASRHHDRRLRTLVEPDSAFLAQIAGGLRHPDASGARVGLGAASAIYAAVADHFSGPWPRTTISRAL